MANAANIPLVQDAVALLQASGLTRPADVESSLLLRGPQAQVQALAVNDTAVAYLMTPPADTTAADRALLNTLRQQVGDTFDPKELRTLCFELNIPYDELPDDSHALRVQELVAYLRRRGRLADLVAYGRELRAHVTWPDTAAPGDIPARDDVAVVVSMAQPALPSAAAYLDSAGIPAHFVLLTNVPAYDRTEFLSLDSDWEAVGRLFFETLQALRLKFPEARMHLFLAAPVALGFLLGCTWGTVYQGDYLYHLHRDEDNRSRYVRVATISRALRGQA